MPGSDVADFHSAVDALKAAGVCTLRGDEQLEIANAAAASLIADLIKARGRLQAQKHQSTAFSRLSPPTPL